jgi:uncharacterized repeat protein (TIGR03943 family)
VTRSTQALLLTVTGAVLIRMAVDDTYLRYVNTWMRWPLVGCGFLLLLLSLSDLLSSQGAAPDEASHVPRAAWLLFLPSLVLFLVAPPALGAHYAERAQDTPVAVEAAEPAFAPLPEGDPAPLSLEELVVRAAYAGGAETLVGRRLEITGFVSRDRSGRWYVTRFGINCCAADATVTRIVASGVDAPPDDQWVRVVGTHVADTGAGGRTPPEVLVGSLERIDPPRNQYR